ncbi:hypothetical protein AGR7A_pTi0079 [Agrobacterium deltaense NCPPB 1641]|uniref:Uncharacterized protein n=1 Tax=Agrobacterium deltaense NCPPB 1641 TaxID=1183425 RepID=A0A1S7UBS3_9HYPH|nr:hypothetical protein AGR7A_pTi0079 [Agrobacterium deltaense NCPPB 1641]
MTVEWIGDDRAAPRRGLNEVADGRDAAFLSRDAKPKAAEKTGAWLLRKDDRGAAGLRSDMSNRGRVGRARFQQDRKALGNGGRHRHYFPVNRKHRHHRQCPPSSMP